MFDNLSKLIVKFLLMLLVGLLVLSFAVWGIGDMFRGNVSDVVATVGGSDVSGAVYRNAVSAQVSELERMYGQDVEPHIVEAVETRVLHMMVNSRMLELEVERQGLHVSDEMVVGRIAADPRFSNENGVFDKRFFRAWLQQNGQSESLFVQEIKNDIAIEMLLGTLSEPPILSDTVIGILNAYEGEQRAIRLLVIPPDHIKNVPEPSNNELIAYYDREKTQFMAPEYRTVSYIHLGIDAVKDKIDVSDEVLKLAYEEQADEFLVPEMRTLQHMFLADEETAKAAHAMLVEGKSFAEVAKDKADQDEDAIAYGETSREDLRQGGLMPDALVDAVFGLDDKAFSDPLQSSIGWHLFQVTDISPELIKTFDEVKHQLSTSLLEDKSGDLIYALAGQLEDALAGGATLKEAAEALGLTLHTVDSISEDGRFLGGEQAELEEVFDQILPQAFLSTVGEESQLTDTQDGLGYFIFTVDSITEVRERALDEVRGSVTSAWKAYKKDTELKELADETATSLRSRGVSSDGDLNSSVFERVANTLGLELVNTEPFFRTSYPVEVLPGLLVDEVFGLVIGDFSNVHERDDGAWVIAELKQVIAAEESTESVGANAIQQRLETQFSEDLFSQYMMYLRLQYPVEYYNR